MKLISVTANQHVLNGNVTGKPVRLLLTFDDGQTLRLAVAGDGQGMLVDRLPLEEPFNLAELGSLVIEDVTRSLDARLQNANVIHAQPLLLDGQRVGVQLVLDEHPFHFWVDGDELWWGNDNVLSAHEWLQGIAPIAAQQPLI